MALAVRAYHLVMGGQQSREAGTSETAVSESPSACPLPESARSKAVYNVYNQRMDSSDCPKMVRR